MIHPNAKLKRYPALFSGRRPLAAALGFVSCVLGFALFSCVPADQLPPGSVPGLGGVAQSTSTVVYGALEPGNTSITSIHFTYKGYYESDLQAMSTLAETLYNKLGNDTGLYSSMASGSYVIVLYKDQNEYLTKTHQPAWSRITSSGNTFYTYSSADVQPYLAHELARVVLQNYLGNDNARSLRWLIEGVAMVEEVSQMPESDRSAFQSSAATNLHNNKMPFSQMTFFVSDSDEKRRTDVWYQQVESVVSYILAQSSSLAFGQMLSELQTGTNLDKAISDNYGAKFRSMADLENLWKYTV